VLGLIGLLSLPQPVRISIDIKATPQGVSVRGEKIFMSRPLVEKYSLDFFAAALVPLSGQ
jgi:hypothetical protein